MPGDPRTTIQTIPLNERGSVMHYQTCNPPVGTDQNARGLLGALGMDHRHAAIGIGDNEWIVCLRIPCKEPDLANWKGWPVRYQRMGEVMAL